jgi:signal peptidase I
MTWKSALRENLESILFPLILVLITRTFIFQAFKIPSASMENTLLIGDHILVNKSLYFDRIPGLGFSLFPTRDPQRRDIMVFKFPNEPTKDYIKRLIGVGGDTVTVRRPYLFINGQLMDEQYAVYKYDLKRKDGDFHVPQGKTFMMGDNRDNSEDSRFWGYLDRDLIKGKAFIIYFSWDITQFDREMSSSTFLWGPVAFLKTIRLGRTFRLLD